MNPFRIVITGEVKKYHTYHDLFEEASKLKLQHGDIHDIITTLSGGEPVSGNAPTPTKGAFTSSSAQPRKEGDESCSVLTKAEQSPTEILTRSGNATPTVRPAGVAKIVERAAIEIRDLARFGDKIFQDGTIDLLVTRACEEYEKACETSAKRSRLDQGQIIADLRTQLHQLRQQLEDKTKPAGVAERCQHGKVYCWICNPPPSPRL
jgi:hypothetical protein